MEHITTNSSITSYLENVPLGSIHLAIYETCWFIRELQYRNDTTKGINLRSSFNDNGVFSFGRAMCRATSITHLGNSLQEAATNYPEYFL